MSIDPKLVQEMILAHYRTLPHQQPPEPKPLAPGHVRVLEEECDCGTLVGFVEVSADHGYWGVKFDILDQLYQDYLTAKRDLEMVMEAIETYDIKG